MFPHGTSQFRYTGNFSLHLLNKLFILIDDFLHIFLYDVNRLWGKTRVHKIAHISLENSQLQVNGKRSGKLVITYNFRPFSRMPPLKWDYPPTSPISSFNSSNRSPVRKWSRDPPKRTLRLQGTSLLPVIPMTQPHERTLFPLSTSLDLVLFLCQMHVETSAFPETIKRTVRSEQKSQHPSWKLARATCLEGRINLK